MLDAEERAAFLLVSSPPMTKCRRLSAGG